MNTKTKPWKNEDLMIEFHRLNQLYFDGLLPCPVHISFASIDGLGHTSRFRQHGKRRSQFDGYGINISNKLRYSRRLWLGTLVHEMVHVEHGLKYSCGVRGKRFNGRMRQLAFQGAFDGIW